MKKKTPASSGRSIRKWNSRGLTLIELLMAMTAASILGLAVISAYETNSRTYITENRMVEMQQDVRAAMLMMEYDIRMAGFLRNDSGFQTAKKNEIKFVAGNEVFHYGWNTSGNFGREVHLTGEPDSSLQPIAMTIDAVNFLYFGMDVDGDGDPDADGRGVPVQLEFDGSDQIPPENFRFIRSVQVTVVARSGETLSGFFRGGVDHTVYRNQAGDAIFTAPGDGFRRIRLTADIKCRNIGLPGKPPVI